MFLKIWCFSKKRLILCNCFRIFEKALHTPCTFEDSNCCHLLDGARFVLKSFFAYKYLWGVSTQLSSPRGSEAANLSRQWKWVLPSVIKALLRKKGRQENDKTVTMAPLGFLNEDVKTAGSTKDIIYYHFFRIHFLSKNDECQDNWKWVTVTSRRLEWEVLQGRRVEDVKWYTYHCRPSLVWLWTFLCHLNLLSRACQHFTADSIVDLWPTLVYQCHVKPGNCGLCVRGARRWNEL